MTITAVTPDGVSHEFPDGTDGGVISSAVKTYLSKTAAPDSSFGADLKAGAGGAMSAVGNLSQGLGSVSNSAGLPDAVGSSLNSAGSWLKSNAPAVPNYHDRGGDIVHDLGQGEFSKAGGDVLHGLVGSLPTLGATALAGATTGPVGAAAVAGGLGLGTAAGQRAAAEGQASPSTSDVVRSLPRAGADAVLGGLGFGKLGTSAAKRLLAAGGASGLQSGVDQADATGTVDPSQMANSAILGAGTAGALEGAGAARGAASGVSNNLMSRASQFQPTSDAHAQALARVGQAIDDRTASTPGNSANQIANNLKTDWKAEMATKIQAAKDQGASPEALVRMKTILQQAATHNNTTSEDLESSLGALTGTDHGMTDDQLNDFTEQSHDLNAISRQSFTGKNVGPGQMIGGAAGRYGAPVFELAHGSPMGALAALGVGHSPVGKLAEGTGSQVGKLLDNVAGTSVPPIVLQRLAAQRYLKAKGLPPTNAAEGVTGNAPDPVPVNQPVAANTAPQAAATPSALPPLRANTPDDVNHAMAGDPTMAAAAQGAVQQQAGFQTPGAKFVGRPLGYTDHQQSVDAAQAAEDAGLVPKGTAQTVNTSTAYLHPTIAKIIQDHAAGELAKVGIDQMTGSTKGVFNPLSYAANLRQEDSTYGNVPADLKNVADVIRNPDLNGKTKKGRAALLQLAMSLQKDPAAAARMQQQLGPLTGYGQGPQ